MKDVLIVGDGPGGLSAALLLAKNDMDVAVFGTDETPMHKAMLYNYLGIPEITGSEFQEVARAQVASFGADLHEAKVSALRQEDDQFVVETEGGQVYQGRYVILALAQKPLLNSLGLDAQPEVDRDGRTEIEGVYVVGWPVRRQKIQAIISAGDGAAAALGILSEEAGEPIHDFDVIES